MRRTEFLRPEGLLPVGVVAERLGVSVATVHAAINAGKLRWVLFGSVRRVRPEDLEAFVRSRSASRPPADDGWYTVADLMRATGFSRSKAYGLLERGILPFQVFAGIRHVRRGDVSDFLRTTKNTQGMPSSFRHGRGFGKRQVGPWGPVIPVEVGPDQTGGDTLT